MTLGNEKIINEDPYGQDYNHSKLNLPDQTEVDYNEEAYTMSIRLSHYFSLLSHINKNDVLNLNTLTPNRLFKLEKIINFLDWKRLFDPQPLEINTEALNKVLFYYQKDRGQQYIILTLKSTTKDLENYSAEFVELLKPIKLYLNEKYKLFLRKNIIPLVKLPPQLQGQNIKKAHDLVTYKVKELGKTLYIELIGEVLKEDFTADGEVERERILERIKGLDGSKPIQKREKKQKKPEEYLVESLIELSTIPSQLESITEKLAENLDLFMYEKFSLLEKIIDFIKHSLLGHKRNTILQLDVQEPPEEKTVSKRIEIEKFIHRFEGFCKKLEGYKNTECDQLSEIMSKSEEEIKIVVHQTLSKVRYNYKILVGLDNFYRKHLNVSKGIQIELKVLFSALNKSQNSYFEYNKLKREADISTTYKPDINLTT